MRRRTFIALAAAAWAPTVWAQTERRRRIGMLLARRPDDPESRLFVDAFKQGLEQLGWVADRDYRVEHRWLPRDPAEARIFADELLTGGVEILVVLSTPYLRAARAATETVPIVFVGTADPIGQGFVPGLSRPGGNMTGFASEEPSLGGKWLGLLKEVAPAVRHCAVLFHPDSAPAVPQFLASIGEIGRTLSVDTAAAPIRDEQEIDGAISAAALTPNGGLIFLPDAFTLAKRSYVIARVAAHAIPAIFYHRAYAQAGGLLSYGIHRPQQFRQAARYVQLILTGTNPVDLPVQQPTEFELAINLRTAKSLGLEISPAFLARADEVIE